MSALHNHVWLNNFSFLPLSASSCLEISSLLKVQPASQIWWIPDFLQEKGLPKSLVHVFWVDYPIIFCLHFSGSLKAEHGSCCPPKLMSGWVWKFSTISLSQGVNLLIHVSHSDFINEKFQTNMVTLFYKYVNLYRVRCAVEAFICSHHLKSFLIT